jgi:hypothetical protein
MRFLLYQVLAYNSNKLSHFFSYLIMLALEVPTRAWRANAQNVLCNDAKLAPPNAGYQ